jgi:hypothetical protein
MTGAPNGILIRNPLVYEAGLEATERQAAAAAAAAPGELLPDDVRTWLARARLLEGVPFQHLVPDSDLLPPESIRFFFLDREWTDALVQGALSVGTITTLDREQLQGLHGAIRNEVDAEERRVRMVGGENVGFAKGATITGFLLRSRAVSGWPALHVRGYVEDLLSDDAKPPTNPSIYVRLLRLERLAPAVLLCLFDGVPAVVHIEEPRAGVQYGIDLPETPGAPAFVPLRDVTTGIRLDHLPGAGAKFTSVPFRFGSPGVINVEHLAKRIAPVQAVNADKVEGPGLSSGEMAMELLQFPFRQVFGDLGEQGLAADDPRASFRPTIGADTVREWEDER